MKKLILMYLGIAISLLSAAQSADNIKLIELGKTYKNFMFRNTPDKDVLKEVRRDVPPGIKATAEFIAQTITSGNKLLSKEFISLPDDITLKNIYIVRAVNINVRQEPALDNSKLVDSLQATTISHYELVDNYYSLLFTAVGNKNKPFDFSRIDFKLKEYKLKDDTEKGIFFLRCISACGMEIWGYMNIPKPPNTKEAYRTIGLFPKFNGQAYYQFTDLNFPDFEMKIVNDKGPQSYKGYYIDKYYEVLLSHLICLNKEGGSEKDRNDLLLGSILKDSNYYRYTKYKETLEKIFTVVKQN